MVSIVHFSIINLERNDRLYLAFMNYDYFENKKPKLLKVYKWNNSKCLKILNRVHFDINHKLFNT
jgi:hypothetical protein